MKRAHLIDKAMTLEPRGINKRDELNQGEIYLFSSLYKSFSVFYIFKSRKCNVHLVFVFIFLGPVELSLCCKQKYRAEIVQHFIFLFLFSKLFFLSLFLP